MLETCVSSLSERVDSFDIRRCAEMKTTYAAYCLSQRHTHTHIAPRAVQPKHCDAAAAAAAAGETRKALLDGNDVMKLTDTPVFTTNADSQSNAINN